MSRIVLSVVLLLSVFSAMHTWAEDTLSPEVLDFLKHRNVLLSLGFEHGSNELTQDSKQSLERVATDLKALLDSNKIVRIEGYAAPAGNEDYNLVLSMRRAMAVHEYLQSRYGLELDLYFNGYGSEREPAQKIVQLAFYDDTLGLALADIDAIVTQ